MAVDKNDLLSTLGSLTDDELASIGLSKVKTIDSPFRAKSSSPDRVKKVDADQRWYQLQVGSYVAELHISDGECVIHRYGRRFTPPASKYLLDGFEGIETLDASDLKDADDASIWSELARLAPSNKNRKVKQTYQRHR
jgi:hypothetical protein